MRAIEKRLSASNNQLIRGAILIYWSIFWMFNIVDKVIGGSMFLWVGRDRFAQFQKYFASAGLEFGTDENPDWVHISYKKDSRNRHQVLKAVRKDGKTKYEFYAG